MITNHVGFYYRGTTAERTALSPQTSSVCWDTDLSRWFRWNGSAWQHCFASELALADLADYAQGSVIRGEAADWGAHDAKTNHFLLVGDGTDIVSKAFDWDDMAAGAAADMAHDHSAAGEGGANLRDILELQMGASAELTIAAGAVTRTQVCHTIDTQSDDAADDLDTISGGIEGDFLIIRAVNAARVATLKHNTGNLFLRGAADIDMDDATTLYFFQYGADAKWHDLGGGGGGGASTFLALTDTPADFTDDALKFPRVNAGENALEWVAVAPGAGGPADYPYAGFGTDGDLSDEVNLYDFFGANLIKNSPGQIVVDGAEPQWWDDVANATITDEDAAGEACSDLFERVFKVVTVANDVYGYQTCTFADEELLDAGATVVSLGVWVWCAAATTASVAIYGTNLGLQESSQHTGGSGWELLTVEAKTLNAADASIQVRLICDTGTAFFAAPMLNVGPKAMPWKARGTKFVGKELLVLNSGPHTETVAWTDQDMTAHTDPLAVAIAAWVFLLIQGADVWRICLRSNYSSANVWDAYVLTHGGSGRAVSGGTIAVDDANILEYYTENQTDASTVLTLYIGMHGYWMWE